MWTHVLAQFHAIVQLIVEYTCATNNISFVNNHLDARALIKLNAIDYIYLIKHLTELECFVKQDKLLGVKV